MTNYKGFEIEAEDEQDHESGIYLSISDLMSSLFLFFALLFITVLVQLKEYQDQSSKQKILSSARYRDNLSQITSLSR